MCEQGAAHAADGYARATGRVGVCLATSGPGATNLVTGIATAYMDSVPVVAITCNVTLPLLGKDSFQEVDIAGEECNRYGTVLILDEIQSGYGRSGRFFAHQYSGIRPDIITCAKGIATGFPMGAVLISPMFKPSYGMLGTTFGGNHLACATAIAVLDIIEEEHLVKNAAKVGQYLIDRLKDMPEIKEVRGLGLMIGIEMPFEVKELRRHLINVEHVFTGAASTDIVRLLPPLTLTIAQADDFLERFRRALTAL